MFECSIRLGVVVFKPCFLVYIKLRNEADVLKRLVCLINRLFLSVETNGWKTKRHSVRYRLEQKTRSLLTFLMFWHKSESVLEQSDRIPGNGCIISACGD